MVRVGGDRHQPVPAAMNGRTYPVRPIVGIGVAVMQAGRVLLIRRGRPPAQGAWSLPGGAQELGETIEQAARRELLEETGISAGALHLAAAIDSIHRDSAGAVEYHYTILDFAAHWQAGVPRPGSDATQALWADRDALDVYQLSTETRYVIARALTLLG